MKKQMQLILYEKLTVGQERPERGDLVWNLRPFYIVQT